MTDATYQENLDAWTNMECDAPSYVREYSDEEMDAAEQMAEDRDAYLADREEDRLRELDLL